jgi:hypothetical protein
MIGADLAERWQRYLNAYMAEWDVPEDLRYAPAGPGQEPVPVLQSHDARVYATWLRLQGHITKAEERWLYDDIARAEAEQAES